MSYDYSENILVQESAGHLLEDELGWHVELAYNTEVLGETGTFGRKSYKEILLVKYLKEALLKLNPWLTPALLEDAIKTFESHMSSASLMQINEEKIKAKISELDHWTEKQETKAEVDTLIGTILWEELPESYSDNAIFAYRQKIYEYVFMRYKEVA